MYIPPKKAMLNLDVNAGAGGAGGFESVGQSLLAQKRADAATAERREKRKDLAMKGLTLLSFGASMYRGQSKKRAKELEDAQAYSLSGAKNNAEHLRTLGAIKQVVRNKSYDEIISNSEDFNRATTSLRPTIEVALKARYSDKGYDQMPRIQFDQEVDVGTKEALKYLIVPEEGEEFSRLDKSLKLLYGSPIFREGVRDDADLTEAQKENVLTQVLNLTEGELEGRIKKLYTQKRHELENNDGILSFTNARNLLAETGLIAEKEGGINLWKQLDETNIMKTTPDLMISAAKIHTNLIPVIQDAIIANSNKDYRGAVVSNKDNPGTLESDAYKNISETRILEQDIDNNVARNFGEFVSTLALTDDMEEIIQEMDKTVYAEGGGENEGLLQGEGIKVDAASLYMRLGTKEEEEFKKQLYMSSAHAEALRSGLNPDGDTQEQEAYEQYISNRVQEFADEIGLAGNEDQRAKFSILTVLRVGAVEKEPFSDLLGMQDYSYDTNRVRNLLQPAIERGSEGYMKGRAWQYLDREGGTRQKKNIIFLELNEILESPNLDESGKQMLAENLYNNLVSKDMFDSQEKFISAYAEWIPKWKGQANHFRLYGNLSHGDEFDHDYNANAAAQFQQRLWGNEIDKKLGHIISKGKRSGMKEIQEFNVWD